MRFERTGALALYPKALGQEFEIAVGVSGVERPDFDVVGPFAIVDVRDPLVHHKHWRWDSYEAIVERVSKAFSESGAEAVLMRVNSPGGDVDGCFDAARMLRHMADEAGKPLLAYGDGMIASAAYALACAADRIYVSATTNIGSIGIIEGLVSQTEADARAGLRYEIISSGARKSDGNPHVPISDEAVANLQGQVDTLAELFFALVEELRGFPADKARGLQARMLLGTQAVPEGLADEVVTWSALAHGPLPKVAQRGAGDRMSAKAMNLRQHMAWAAEHGDDEEKELAKKMTKAIEEGDGDGNEPPEKKKDEKSEGKKAKAEGEGEGKKASAESEGEGEGKKASADSESEGEGEGEGEGKRGKKAKKGEGEGEGRRMESEGEGEGKKAAARAPDVFAMAPELQELKAERAAEKESIARKALYAKRPDFDAKMIAYLDELPVTKVKEAVETFPRIGGKALAPAAAQFAMGTRGKGHTGNPDDISEAPAEIADHIARKMGVTPKSKGVVFEGRTLELGHMSHEEAQAFLKKHDAAANADGTEGK
jgi:ClpP class serine protease